MKISDKPQPTKPVMYFKLHDNRSILRTMVRGLIAARPYPRNHLYKVLGREEVLEVATGLNIHQRRIKGKIHWQLFEPEAAKKLVFKSINDA